MPCLSPYHTTTVKYVHHQRHNTFLEIEKQRFLFIIKSALSNNLIYLVHYFTRLYFWGTFNFVRKMRYTRQYFWGNFDFVRKLRYRIVEVCQGPLRYYNIFFQLNQLISWQSTLIVNTELLFQRYLNSVILGSRQPLLQL